MLSAVYRKGLICTGQQLCRRQYGVWKKFQWRNSWVEEVIWNTEAKTGKQLSCNFEEIGWGNVQLEPCASGYGLVGSRCEHSKNHSASMKRKWNFFTVWEHISCSRTELVIRHIHVGVWPFRHGCFRRPFYHYTSLPRDTETPMSFLETPNLVIRFQWTGNSVYVLSLQDIRLFHLYPTVTFWFPRSVLFAGSENNS